MEYVTAYSCVSSLFLTVTAVFFFRQRRVPNVKNHIYSIMLVSGLIASVFDYLAAVINPVASMYPAFIVYAMNMIFLIALHTCLPAFAYYALILTGSAVKLRSGKTWLIFVPYAVILLLILLSTFTKHGIFYLDENNAYCFGSTHMALYVVSVIYMLVGTGDVFIHRKSIAKRKTFAIFLFTGIIIVVMGIQMLEPRYLLTSTATALALTVMYYVLQSPSDHIDPVTNTFNRVAFSALLQDLYEQKQDFSVLILSVQSLKLINYTFGAHAGESVLSQFARFLRDTYSESAVVRVSHDVFVLLCDKKTTLDEMRIIQKSVPKSFKIIDGQVEFGVWTALIDGERADDTKQMLALVDYTLQKRRQNDTSAVVEVDEAVKREFLLYQELEVMLINAMNRDEIRVHYQPVIGGNGEVKALEALVRVMNKDFQSIPTIDFIHMAERTGVIHRLGDFILEKVCAFVKRSDECGAGVPSISINLSIVQLMREGLSQSSIGIVNNYGVDPGRICFEITENEAAATMPIVNQNIDSLTAAGFRFLMDDFGVGYANLGFLSKRELTCVKIESSILHDAMRERKQMALLEGVNDVLNRLGLPSVCKGVETEQQKEALARIGIDMYQGFYFAKPLDENAMIDYLKLKKAEE